MRITNIVNMLPQKRKYLQNKLVFIIHEYSFFGLYKVKYLDEEEEFIIDGDLITDYPITEHTININIIGD